MKTLLTTWKEIASYLGRSVRTIQRWEREYALPVHRPAHKQSRLVIADKDEIDVWVRHWEANEDQPSRVLTSREPKADVEILREIGRRGPSSTVLSALVEFAERNLSCEFAEISLLDNKLKRRYQAAGPGVPKSLLESHDFQSMAPGYGAWGAAASARKSVFSNSVNTDPQWVNVRNIARKHGIAACWAEPVIVDGNTIAIVAAYFRNEAEPSYDDRTFLALVASIAGLSLRMNGVTEPLDRFQKSAAFILVDGDFRVCATNRDACRILDKPSKEIVGQRLWDLCPNADPLARTEYEKALNQRIAVGFEFMCAALGVRLTIVARPSGEGLEILFRAAAPRHSNEAA